MCTQGKQCVLKAQLAQADSLPTGQSLHIASVLSSLDFQSLIVHGGNQGVILRFHAALSPKWAAQGYLSRQ